jgi:hypothetical protein
MNKYKITYVPNSASDREGLDTEVEALGHHIKGRFIVFVTEGGQPVLQLAAAHVLQIKTVAE